VQAEADLVIGADGLNSKVRDHLLGPEKPRYTGHIAHRAIFPATRLNGLPIRACTKWWGVAPMPHAPRHCDFDYTALRAHVLVSHRNLAHLSLPWM
jgi:2-polyprenyl-6-methoxyphenol hydroxylase-like FAD-dependent oxidoreductase